MAIRIEPLEGPIGALVHGLDSRRSLGAGDFAAVEQTVFDNIAIVIPYLEKNSPAARYRPPLRPPGAPCAGPV